MRLFRMITVITAMVFLSIISAQAYPVANSFQFPLDSYVVNCNELGTKDKCVQNGKYHLGEDASAKAPNKVYAIADGEIKWAKYHAPTYNSDGVLLYKNYGGLIIIEHTTLIINI